MPSHPHFCTFNSIENFHPLSLAFCLNHPQSPAFCLTETKLSRQIFSQEEKNKYWPKIYLNLMNQTSYARVMKFKPYCPPYSDGLANYEHY